MQFLILIIFGIISMIAGFYIGKYYMNKNLRFLKESNEDLTIKLDMCLAKNSTLLATLNKQRQIEITPNNKEKEIQIISKKQESINQMVQVSDEEIFKNYGKVVKLNDFKIIEGIGPKLEKLLNQSEILTWADLANTSTETLKVFLNTYGNRFTLHDPSTWPKQAELAARGKWAELKDYQSK